MIYKTTSYLLLLKTATGFIFIIAILLIGFFKKKLPLIKSLKKILNIIIVVILFQALLEASLNWWLWSKEKITQRLLPPFTSITYVLHYSWQHYLFEPIVTIIFSLIIFWGIKALNKKFNNTFFYDEEKYLATLGILATGWPNCLIYLTLVLFLGMVFHFIYLIISLIRRKIGLGRMIQGRDNNENSIKGEVLGAPPLQMSASLNFRLSLLYFWLPCALLVLFLGGIISKYLIINQLVI